MQRALTPFFGHWFCRFSILIPLAAAAFHLITGSGSFSVPAWGAEFDQTAPVEGLRSNLPRVHALIGARLVTGPGESIESGTILVRDGVIEDLGADVAVPSDARRWDLAGKTIYPGLIDAYGHIDVPAVAADQGTPYWNPHVQPERLVGALFKTDESRNRVLRSQGITAKLLAPNDGIVRGQSTVVTTGNGGRNHAVLRPQAALHLRLTASRGSRDQYPGSPMGAVALARQTFYDANWYRDAWRAFQAQPGVAPPERNSALEALVPYVDDKRLVIIETPDEQYLLRGEQFAREFGLRVAFLGSGQEYRRIDAIRDTGRAVIVGVNFPDAPNVGTPEAAADVSLERLMHWRLAPENPARLHDAGVTIALTSHGLDKPAEFLKNVRQAVKRGLDKDAALAALTINPARLLEIDQRLGTLQRGKLAHLVVTDGDLFAEKTKVVQTWVDGEVFVLQSEAEMDLRGTWHVASSGGASLPPLVIEGDSPRQLKGHWQLQSETPESKEETSEGDEEAQQEAEDEGKDDEDEEEEDEDEDEDEDDQEERDEEDDDEEADGDESSKDQPKNVPLKKLQLRGTQLVAQFNASVLAALESGETPGVAQLSLTVVPVEGGWKMIGQVVDPLTRSTPVVATQAPEDEPAEEAKQDESEADGDSDEDDSDEDESGEESDDGDEASGTDAASTGDKASSEIQIDVNFPLGAYGRTAPPEQPAAILFRGATVWTCGDAGILETGDVLVEAGKISQVAPRIDAYPEGTIVVDAAGMHLTPGIIDCHSHIATDGGVNESTQSITAEVRIGDFIDGRDIAIYRQLAGGVTAASILHGSANPIGGQNQVIKFRWGALPEEMKFAEAPPGIKFALGENVKQSNWGDRYTSRYPQSRMGVEQIVRDAFLAARQYRHAHRQWQQTRKGLPPRFDLELEALVEIQDGKRWIHCHSYRQDEILALLRTLESLNIQIGTLQHILEGYKVADAIKNHGAMASAFSDWWAYKIETYDAIPFNGALMHEMGVVVSFNSDDAELARHLNHEAAKAVKYGGVPPEEALKFVTLNPARQLRIDQYVGSIEPGKHADLVLWHGSPLSTMSRCEQTWIDGRKYFDRGEDQQQQQRSREMRAALIQKILDSGAKMQSEDESNREERDLWPRVDIYCRVHAECLREAIERGR